MPSKQSKRYKWTGDRLADGEEVRITVEKRPFCERVGRPTSFAKGFQAV